MFRFNSIHDKPNDFEVKLNAHDNVEWIDRQIIPKNLQKSYLQKRLCRLNEEPNQFEQCPSTFNATQLFLNDYSENIDSSPLKESAKVRVVQLKFERIILFYFVCFPI